jgi:hypothetical protein
MEQTVLETVSEIYPSRDQVLEIGALYLEVTEERL